MMGVRVVWGEMDPETGFSADVPAPDAFRCALGDPSGTERAEQIVREHNEALLRADPAA